MQQQHEQGSLNGYPTLYLMVGELRQGQRHLENGLHVLSDKVERLERNSRRRKLPVPRGLMSSLGLSGRELLILGFAAGLGITGTLTPEMVRALLIGH